MPPSHTHIYLFMNMARHVEWKCGSRSVLDTHKTLGMVWWRSLSHRYLYQLWGLGAYRILFIVYVEMFEENHSEMGVSVRGESGWVDGTILGKNFNLLVHYFRNFHLSPSLYCGFASWRKRISQGLKSFFDLFLLAQVVLTAAMSFIYRKGISGLKI